MAALYKRLRHIAAVSKRENSAAVQNALDSVQACTSTVVTNLSVIWRQLLQGRELL